MALKHGKLVDADLHTTYPDTNETIQATRQEFFFTKITPIQSITDIALFDFD